MNSDLRREIILEHNQHPKHFGLVGNDFEKIKANNTSCIDQFDLEIKIVGDKLIDLHFAGEGCAISKSTTSIMCDLVIGKSIDEAKKIINNYLAMISERPYDKELLDEAIVFSEVYKQPNRITCATLTWSALSEYLETK